LIAENEVQDMMPSKTLFPCEIT